MREEIIRSVAENRIITIVRGVYGEQIVDLAQALYAGGIRMMEITFDQKNTQDWNRTAQAITCVAEKMKGRMLVGAGTVTSVQLVELAHEAGAQYIISPDCQLPVIQRTLELGMVSMPGALTPTEIANAHHAGADFIKVFPAAQLTPAYIKAVRAPLNQIRLMAVGGVNEKNAGEFIRAGCVGVGVGGNLVNKEWIAKGEWQKITDLARVFCAEVKGAPETK